MFSLSHYLLCLCIVQVNGFIHAARPSYYKRPTVNTDRLKFGTERFTGIHDNLNNTHPSLKLGSNVTQINDDRKGDNVRAIAYGSIWLALVLYSSFLSPGHNVAAEAADKAFFQAVMSNPLSPELNPIFLIIFNSFGVVTASYAQLLLPASKNQKPIPAAPFVFGSIAGGFFILGPYLALRNYRYSVDAESLNTMSTISNSKASGILTLLGAVGLAFLGIQSDALSTWSDFVDMFHSSTLVNISCIDISILSLVMWEPMLEDMRRRGMFRSGTPMEILRLAIFSFVPIIGPSFYLAIRPELISKESE